MGMLQWIIVEASNEDLINFTERKDETTHLQNGMATH
jgi:hypothetical protein